MSRGEKFVWSGGPEEADPLPESAVRSQGGTHFEKDGTFFLRDTSLSKPDFLLLPCSRLFCKMDGEGAPPIISRWRSHVPALRCLLLSSAFHLRILVRAYLSVLAGARRESFPDASPIMLNLASEVLWKARTRWVAGGYIARL
jgi:hypothetical protein